MAGASEARYMKKKVTTGEIEADPENLCINVHYEIEVTVLGDNEEPLMTEKKRDVKRYHSFFTNPALH
jgi:hypothetical protein